MSRFSVEIRGLARLRRKLDAGHLLLPGVASMIGRLTLLAEREAKLGAPRDTANLQRNIVSEVRPLLGKVQVIGTARSYGAVMEFGRRPGARMPPPDALAGWARRHGFGTSPGALFVLARAIARGGIWGRFFMRRAAQAVRRDLPGALRDLAGDIAVRWRRA